MGIKRRRKQEVIISFAGDMLQLGAYMDDRNTGEFYGGKPVVEMDIKPSDSSILSPGSEQINNIDQTTIREVPKQKIFNKALKHRGVRLIISDKDGKSLIDWLVKDLLEEINSLKRQIEHLQRIATGEEVKSQELAYGMESQVIKHAALQKKINEKPAELESQPTFVRGKPKQYGDDVDE